VYPLLPAAAAHVQLDEGLLAPLHRLDDLLEAEAALARGTRTSCDEVLEAEDLVRLRVGVGVGVRAWVRSWVRVRAWG